MGAPYEESRPMTFDRVFSLFAAVSFAGIFAAAVAFNWELLGILGASIVANFF